MRLHEGKDFGGVALYLIDLPDMGDLAIGTERVSRQIDGLCFIPLLEERFDLAVRRQFLETAAGETLLRILRSEPFIKEISHFTGNDYRDTGRIIAEV